MMVDSNAVKLLKAAGAGRLIDYGGRDAHAFPGGFHVITDN